MVNIISHKGICKEGLIVKHGEVDVSRIMTAVKITQVTWTVTIMLSMQLD